MNKIQKRKRNQRKLAKARLAKKKDNYSLWKKFCLDLTNACLPSLIADDLVTVQPMSSLKTEVKDNEDDFYVGQVFDQTVIPTINNKSLKQRYIETLANALKMIKK